MNETCNHVFMTWVQAYLYLNADKKNYVSEAFQQKAPQKVGTHFACLLLGYIKHIKSFSANQSKRKAL